MKEFKDLTIPQLLHARHADNLSAVAQLEKDANGTFQAISFGEMWQSVQSIAGGFIALGVAPGDRVMHVSDNRSDWLHLCLAINSLGAIDIPLGSDSTKKDLEYILGHADPKICILENAVLYDSISDSAAKHICFVLVDNSKATVKKTGNHTIYNLEEVKAMAPLDDASLIQKISQGKPQDTSTIIYTSGTTGDPKGVMLSHRNFTFQLEILSKHKLLSNADTVLCVLPVWHSFERIANILGTYSLATLAYSKPVAAAMIADMAIVKPTLMASVPRIWESVRLGVFRAMKRAPAIRRGLFNFFLSIGYANAHLSNLQHDLFARIGKKAPGFCTKLCAVVGRIFLAPLNLLGKILVFKKLKHRLGGRFRLGISGAGALHPITYSFFQAVGIKLCEGYGLTETAPVLAINAVDGNRSGTVGRMLDAVDYRIVTPDGTPCNPGEQGELVVKSEQIMKGYFKDERTTKKVLSSDGWFSTGDLVVETDQKDIKILGRLKDTIVLTSGKNVEPAPIEDALSSSQYIDLAFVVGQDQNRLGALLFANKDSLVEYAQEEKIEYSSLNELCKNPTILAMLSKVVNSLVNTQSGFHPYELISRFHVLIEELTVGIELSKTMKLKRFVLTQKYKSIIQSLFTK